MNLYDDNVSQNIVTSLVLLAKWKGKTWAFNYMLPNFVKFLTDYYTSVTGEKEATATVNKRLNRVLEVIKLCLSKYCFTILISNGVCPSKLELQIFYHT